MSWRPVDPTPFRGWIRWAPKLWRPARRLHLDLASLRLVWPGEGGAAEPPPPRGAEPDLVYLPPVEAEDEALRDDLAAELDAEGHLPAVQLHAGQREAGGAAVALLDPTSLLLRGGGVPAPPFAPPRPAACDLVALVPLLPGLFDEGGLEQLLDALAALAPSALVGVTPRLTPLDRRRLVEALGEERFEAVFHGRAPEEREVARGAARRGIRCLPARPSSLGLAPRAARNRELASALVEAGELWLRLGRSEGEGVALLAAARRVEELALDVGALALERNLPVLDFLSATGRRVVGEAATGEPGLLAALRSEWCGAEAR